MELNCENEKIKIYKTIKNITLHYFDKERFGYLGMATASISEYIFINSEKTWFFNRLFVPHIMRGNNIATELMRELIKILDSEQITLINEVNPYNDGGLELEGLIKFYKKFGFVDLVLEGKVIGNGLVRYPINIEGEK